MPHLDRDLLPSAGLDFVDIGHCDADPGEDIRRRLSDLEARGKDGIMSRDRDFAASRHTAAANAHEFLKTWIHTSPFLQRLHDATSPRTRRHAPRFGTLGRDDGYSGGAAGGASAETVTKLQTELAKIIGHPEVADRRACRPPTSRQLSPSVCRLA
jgi:hypothetical protein